MKHIINMKKLSLLATVILMVFVVTACKQKVQDDKDTNADQEVAVEEQEGDVDDAGVEDGAMDEDKKVPAKADLSVTPTPSKVVEDIIVGSAEVALFASSGSGVNGNAIIEPLGDRLRVTVNMTDTTRGSIRPVTIQNGACGYSGSTRHVLNNALNGASVTILNTTYQQLKDDEPLSLFMRTSTTDGTSYACGNLSL